MPLPDICEDLEERERALGIVDGQPFLLRPDGTPDRAVLLYFNSSLFRRLAVQTQQSYAADLKVYFSFLELQGKHWRRASEEDFLDYEYWRRRDSRNQRRIGGAKFQRELAACGHFYNWQIGQGVIGKSPITTVPIRRRDGSTEQAVQLRPTNVRSSNVKWLTPRAYRQWRDIGLGGYAADGTRDEQWRGRNDGRNLAFADALWSSGLRLQECSTLLNLELPSFAGGERFVRGRLAEAVAKGSGRDYWISARALQRIQAYKQTGRREAIRRAQRNGRYDDLRDIFLVTSITQRRQLNYIDERGVQGRVALDALDAESRLRVFVDGKEGLEPASVWLTEAGMPMPTATWEVIFSTANQRCKKVGVPIRCHPHMLRHSFALRMLVTLVHAFDRRLGLTAQERREYRKLFGDPWVLVQTLLGHSNLNTTRDIYLEPVNGLQVDLFLNGEDSEDAPVSVLLSYISESSSRVQDKHS